MVDLADVKAAQSAASNPHASAQLAARGRSDVWQPVTVDREALTLTASGARVLRLSRRGLPSSLRVGAVELLAAPAQLRLHGATSGTGASHEIRWSSSAAGPQFAVDANGGVEWVAEGHAKEVAEGGCGGLKVEVRGVLSIAGAFN